MIRVSGLALSVPGRESTLVSKQAGFSLHDGRSDASGITSGSSIDAMILTGPPHFSHFSISMANTRLSLAIGSNAEKKALTLQASLVRDGQARQTDLASKQAGFSLHAGVACKSNRRKKLERLSGYTIVHCVLI